MYNYSCPQNFVAGVRIMHKIIPIIILILVASLPVLPSFALDYYYNLWYWQKGNSFVPSQNSNQICMTVAMPSDTIEDGKNLYHWVYVYTNTGDFIQIGFYYKSINEPKDKLHFFYNVDNSGSPRFIEPISSVNGRTIENYNPGDNYKFCIWHSGPSSDGSVPACWYADFINLTLSANYFGPSLCWAKGDHIVSGGEMFESASYSIKYQVYNMQLPMGKLEVGQGNNLTNIQLFSYSTPEIDQSSTTTYMYAGKTFNFHFIAHYINPPEGIKLFGSPQQIQPTESTQQTQTIPITMSTDISSYKTGDTILIRGHITNPIPNTPVSLLVRNSAQNTISVSLLDPLSNGDFSEAIIASGSLWEESGTYTVVAQYGLNKSTVQFQFTYTPTPPQTSPSQPSSITIVNTTYKVSPSTYQYIPFSIGCSATVNGAFSAYAALGDNIMVFVFDQSNFQKYQNGNAFTAYYESGKIASGSFVLNLNSGTYYIVLSNTYSVISTKNVNLQASYTCN